MPRRGTTRRYLPGLLQKTGSCQSLQESTFRWSSADIPTCSLTERSEGFECRMPAAWECRLGDQAPTGCYLAPTFSFGIRPAISRKLLRAFEPRSIHKLRISPRVMSSNRRQNEKHWKHFLKSHFHLSGADPPVGIFGVLLRNI